MKVEVRVFATLRKYLPELAIGEAKTMEIAPGTTASALRDMLGLPAKEARIIMCNNVQIEPDYILQDGDRITYIPPVAGGSS